MERKKDYVIKRRDEGSVNFCLCYRYMDKTTSELNMEIWEYQGTEGVFFLFMLNNFILCLCIIDGYIMCSQL